MHRKDYILIAKVLKKAKDIPYCSCVDTIISDFCSALKTENTSFNETKFRDYIEKGG